jgi:MYXO-CTERM domain-containing protein
VKRALVLALALCLLVPAGAGAKGGVIFDRYPDVQAVGSQMRFTVMLFDRRDVRPLVTFRNSKTGEVVRTRASRSDLNGIAYGKVAFPSTGPWATAISVNGRPIFEGDAEPFRVGVGLTQTIPSADAERAASDRGGSVSSDRGGSVWPWIALALLASAAAALGVHRRRRWGAA